MNSNEWWWWWWWWQWRTLLEPRNLQGFALLAAGPRSQARPWGRCGRQRLLASDQISLFKQQMCSENHGIKQTQKASRSRDIVIYIYSHIYIAKDQKGACDLVVGQATNAETWMQKSWHSESQKAWDVKIVKCAKNKEKIWKNAIENCTDEHFQWSIQSIESQIICLTVLWALGNA